MKSISVFCGSSSGSRPIYAEKAYTLGSYMANNGIRLIFGGGKVGLMGHVANGALKEDGIVIGVIPTFLERKEVAHRGLTELIQTETMHGRKMKMHELSDASIALPGGFGTMDELLEILTWGQLGLHNYPTGLLNVEGYFDPLCTMLDQMVASGFLKQQNRDMLVVSAEIPELINKMNDYSSGQVEKWITKEQL